MEKSSIICRSHQRIEHSKNPFPLVNFEVQENENGERKFVPSDVVKPSLAKDFDVVSLAMFSNNRSIVSSRDMCDPVDLSENYPELFN